MSHVDLHLVGHHQLRHKGISFITKDVWPNPFFCIINNKQVSISDPTIQRRKLQLFHTSFTKLEIPIKISQNRFT